MLAWVIYIAFGVAFNYWVRRHFSWQPNTTGRQKVFHTALTIAIWPILVLCVVLYG